MENSPSRPRTIKQHLAFVLNPPRFWGRGIPRAAVVPIVIALAFSAIGLPLVRPIVSWRSWINFVTSGLYIFTAVLFLVLELAFTALYRYGRLPPREPAPDHAR